MRTIAFGMMLLFLLCMLTFVFNIRPVEAQGVITIKADGSVDPVTASIVRYGDVYKFTSDIDGGIFIARDDMILDGAGYTLQKEEVMLGIYIYGRKNVTIKNTEITGFWIGIAVMQSSNITIVATNITNNDCGIELDCSGNKIYHNNFIDNYGDVSLLELKYAGIPVEFWDDGYPSGGNYWSKYCSGGCIDIKSGPNQDQPGSDLIGDTPCIIDRYNIDHYPLMTLYGVLPIIPTANFTYSPDNPIAGQTSVVFDATSSKCTNGTITDYIWNFGDGTRASGVTASHIFNIGGSYNVSLRVISNSGLPNIQTTSINVREIPLSIFTVRSAWNGSVLQPITFNASRSTPQGGTILSYFWDLGDGNTTLTYEPIAVHIYTFPKAFKVTLTVLDSEGLNSSCSQWISVMMPTYVSIWTTPPSTSVGFAVDINGTLYDVYKNGLENEVVVLYYTFQGLTTWIPITSDITDNSGGYSIKWIPPATGYFTIKVEWTGNITHFGVNNTITLSSLSYENQYVFCVESNSTISDLTFDAQTRKLSFTATGQDSTWGYAKVIIAKSLVQDVTKLEVHLDGMEQEYSVASSDDAYILTLTYNHSTHEIEIYLPARTSLGTTLLGLDWSTWVIIIIVVAGSGIGVSLIFHKRKRVTSWLRSTR